MKIENINPFAAEGKILKIGRKLLKILAGVETI